MSIVLAFEGTGKRNWTLADEAAAINKEFERLDRADNRRQTAELTSSYARLNAGRGLITAKAMLKREDPDASFEAWCADNIKRNMRDIYKCMRIAGADDPEGALWEERAARAEEMAEGRDQQKCSAAPQDCSVGQQSRSVKTILGIYRNLSAEGRWEVKQGQEEIDNG